MKQLCVLLAVCGLGCAAPGQRVSEAPHTETLEDFYETNLPRLENARSLEDFWAFERKRDANFWRFGNPDPSYKYNMTKQVCALRRQWYCKAHPNLAPKAANAIYRGDLIAGMTPEQVRASWGLPRKVNRTGTAGRIREQWIYGDYDSYVKNYAYFQGGALSSWQTQGR
jgi:hypothetical protein